MSKKRKNKSMQNNPFEQDVVQRGQRSFVTDNTISDRTEKVHNRVLSENTDETLHQDHTRISKSQMRKQRRQSEMLDDVDQYEPKNKGRIKTGSANWVRTSKKERVPILDESSDVNISRHTEETAGKIHANKNSVNTAEPVITETLQEQRTKPVKKPEPVPEHVKKHIKQQKISNKPESPFVQPLSKHAKGIDNQARKAMGAIAPVETPFLTGVQAIVTDVGNNLGALDTKNIRSLEDVVNMARRKVVANRTAMREFIYQREVDRAKLKDGATLTQSDFLLKKSDESRQLNALIQQLNGTIASHKGKPAGPVTDEIATLSKNLGGVIREHSKPLEDAVSNIPVDLGHARKVELSTDKNITEKMMQHLYELRVPKLTKSQMFGALCGVNLDPKYAELTLDDISKVLGKISGGTSVLLPRDTQRRLNQALKVETKENNKKLSELEFFKRTQKKHKHAFEKLNTHDQLNILRAKFASGHDLSGLFRNAMSFAEFEGKGFWQNMGYLMFKKRRVAEQEFVGEQAEKFVRASLTNIKLSPTDIRGNLRVFYTRYIASLDIDPSEKAELLEKVKHAKIKNRSKLGTSDDELKLLQRSMSAKIGEQISNVEFDGLIGDLGGVRELQNKLISIGHSSGAAEINDAVEELLQAKTPKAFYEAKQKIAAAHKSEAIRTIPDEVVANFKKTEQAASALRSSRNAMFRIGATTGIMGGALMGVFGLAGWALTEAMHVSTKANNYLSKIRRQDFGIGRALTTQMTSTTNQRAIQQMQQNRYGSRRFLGLEAQLSGK